METRVLNDQFKKWAEEVINEQNDLWNIKNGHVRIAYLESDVEKKDGKERLVYGQCEKVQPKNKWAIDYDFTITLYRPNILGMSEEQVKVLLFHELLHVGIDRDKDGGEVYSIRKHDLSDFRVIVEKYGPNWATGPKDGNLFAVNENE